MVDIKDSKEDGGSLRAQLAWRTKLKSEFSAKEYQYLSTKRPIMHYYLGLRTFCMYLACAYTLWNYSSLWVVLPTLWFQGCVLTSIGYLNHDIIHQGLWNKRDSDLKISIEVWTGRMWCILPFLSSTFFRAYHGMHHHQFFQGTDDPKSTHFVPKDSSRISRLKFWGPGLIGIFTKLAETVTPILPKDVQRTVYLEKLVNRVVHGVAAIFFITNYGFGTWMKMHFLPHFVFFPIGFMVNRCGQHYCCNPKDSALQSTNCIGNWWNDLTMMYAEYHVEHHTFAEIPCYNLKYANSILKERVYKKINLPQFSFTSLMWGWLVQNRKVYTVWYDLATPY